MNKKYKIDRRKLYHMLREGKTGKQCAEYFGVTESAITQAKQEMNVNIIKNVALENASNIVSKHLNTVDQLQKINTHANDLLDLLTKWINGDEEALKTLETQTKKTKKIRFNDPRELAIKTMAEIRGQLRLQLEIFESLYNMKAIAEFQEEVLDAIGEASKEIRDRIIARLNEKSALRRSISFNK